MVWREIVGNPTLVEVSNYPEGGFFVTGCRWAKCQGSRSFTSASSGRLELGEHFVEVVPRFDLTSTAGEHEAIDHRAGARARGRIAKQPVFPAGAKRTNIPLNEVIIDGG